MVRKVTSKRLIATGFLAFWLVSVIPICEASPAAPVITPDVKEGIIDIECHPQKFTMRRVDGDPYPFYTYVPNDMETERFSGPEGAGIRFWLSRGGGDKRYQAYATIFVFPPGTTREQTRQIIGEMMERSGWEKHEDRHEEKKSFLWALYELKFTADWYKMGAKRIPIGTIAVGRHGNLYFCVMSHYRASFSDGFVPRYLRILDEFMWTDTNEGLPRLEMQRCWKAE
jgi:hypothetical protein